MDYSYVIYYNGAGLWSMRAHDYNALVDPDGEPPSYSIESDAMLPPEGGWKRHYDWKKRLEIKITNRCQACQGAGKVPGWFYGKNQCKACNGTGKHKIRHDEDAKVDAAAASDGDARRLMSSPKASYAEQLRARMERHCRKVGIDV